jgi:3-hydroxy-9,10-secoandrosta-1,3,5(10)-triene-9,17-dione monooxygenase reductase component
LGRTPPCLAFSDDAADKVAFRKVLGRFCSGVTIVTALDVNAPVGMTCQSFFSLSLEPPLIVFSPSRGSGTYRKIQSAGAFCINVLAEDQLELCRRFGSPGDDRWRDVKWWRAGTGSPVLAGCHAWIDCQIEAEHEGGDHFIVVGRVVGIGDTDARPLLFYQGQFPRIDGHEARPLRIAI